MYEKITIIQDIESCFPIYNKIENECIVTVHTHHVYHVMISSDVSDSETLSLSCIKRKAAPKQ